MKSERYIRGLKMIEEVMGEPGLQVLEGLREEQPDFHNYMVEFGFGDIHSRSVLDSKQKQLLTMASLITQGETSSLALHVQAALHIGFTPKEIVEAVIHCLPYAGFPRSLSALNVVIEVFKKKNVTAR